MKFRLILLLILILSQSSFAKFENIKYIVTPSEKLDLVINTILLSEQGGSFISNTSGFTTYVQKILIDKFKKYKSLAAVRIAEKLYKKLNISMILIGISNKDLIIDKVVSQDVNLLIQKYRRALRDFEIKSSFKKWWKKMILKNYNSYVNSLYKYNLRSKTLKTISKYFLIKNRKFIIFITQYMSYTGVSSGCFKNNKCRIILGSEVDTDSFLTYKYFLTKDYFLFLSLHEFFHCFVNPYFHKYYYTVKLFKRNSINSAWNINFRNLYYSLIEGTINAIVFYEFKKMKRLERIANYYIVNRYIRNSINIGLDYFYKKIKKYDNKKFSDFFDKIMINLPAHKLKNQKYGVCPILLNSYDKKYPLFYDYRNKRNYKKRVKSINGIKTTKENLFKLYKKFEKNAWRTVKVRFTDNSITNYNIVYIENYFIK